MSLMYMPNQPHSCKKNVRWKAKVGVQSKPAFHFVKKIYSPGFSFFPARQQCLLFQSTSRSHVSFENVKTVPVVVLPWKATSPASFFNTIIFRKYLRDTELLPHRLPSIPSVEFSHYGQSTKAKHYFVINFLSKMHRLPETPRNERETFSSRSYVVLWEDPFYPQPIFYWRDAREDDGVKTWRWSAVSAGRACGLLSGVIKAFKSIHLILA